MSNRFIRQKVVDIVGQCGLPVTPRREIISETGGLGFKLPRCGVPNRYSQPLPLRSVYRITHIPPPPPTDTAQQYVCQNLDGLENSKLAYSYHPTMHINSPITVFRPRLPILCMKEPLQDKIYEPSTFEEKDLVELPSEAVKARTLRNRTHRLNDLRPLSARTMSNTVVSPLQIHEPNFPSPSLMARTHSHSARAERPNSNSSDFQERSPRNISMKKLKVPPISEDLIPKEIDPEELSRYEESLYYIEDNNDEEEEKEPPNRRLIMIHKLLKGYLKRDKESDYEEEEECDNENQPENDNQQENTEENAMQNNDENINENQDQQEIAPEIENQQESDLQIMIQSTAINLAANAPEAENEKESEIQEKSIVDKENEEQRENISEIENPLQSSLQNAIGNLTENQQETIPEAESQQENPPETENQQENSPEEENLLQSSLQNAIGNLTENQQENPSEAENQQENPPETENQQENVLQSAFQNAVGNLTENN